MFSLLVDVYWYPRKRPEPLASLVMRGTLTVTPVTDSTAIAAKFNAAKLTLTLTRIAANAKFHFARKLSLRQSLVSILITFYLVRVSGKVTSLRTFYITIVSRT